MEEVARSFMDRLEELHNEINGVLEGISSETIHWSPAPGMNSLAVLANHIAGAERFWIGDVAAREPSGRIRDKEFEDSRMEPAALTAILNSSLAYTSKVLHDLSPADWAVMRRSPRDNKEVAVAWALFHALEHTAIHLGHMQLTRQLWEAKNAE